jgi:multiple sugar transport system substrate-binding protein
VRSTPTLEVFSLSDYKNSSLAIYLFKRRCTMRKTLLLTCAFLLLANFIVFAVSEEKGKVTTLTVIGDAGHNLKPFEWYNDAFEEKYGITLKIVGVPFGELYEKEKVEFVAGTGAFDILIVYPKFVGEFAQAGYLVQLDDYAEEYDPKLEDVTPGYRDFYCKFGGKLYALPFDGDVLNLYYRKDLLEHRAEKAAFKREYGYELKVPETWEEYLDVAQFFDRGAGEKVGGVMRNRPFYGTAFYGVKDQIFAWWGNGFASMGGVWFDDRTMKPMINTDIGVEALNYTIELSKCCPPDVLAYGYEELKDVFLNGDCAMVIQWPCVGKKGADPSQSQIVGKVGCAKMPGVRKDGEIYSRALMPCGRVLAISAQSKHPDEAYQILHHLSVETSIDDVSTAETGLDPYRYSHFQHPEEYEMFPSTADAQIYLDGVMANMEIGYPELVIPGAVEYEETLGIWLMKAIAGETSAKAALDAAAKEWEAITDRLGREKQKKLYQSLVKGWRQAGLW